MFIRDTVCWVCWLRAIWGFLRAFCWHHEYTQHWISVLCHTYFEEHTLSNSSTDFQFIISKKGTRPATLAIFCQCVLLPQCACGTYIGVYRSRSSKFPMIQFIHIHFHFLNRHQQLPQPLSVAPDVANWRRRPSQWTNRVDGWLCGCDDVACLSCARRLPLTCGQWPSSCPVTMTLISAVGNSVISGGEFPVIFPVNFVSQ